MTSDENQETHEPTPETPSPNPNPQEELKAQSPLSGKAVRATLSDAQMDVIFFIERFHAVMGESPTDEQITQRFDLPEGFLKSFKVNPLVLKSMTARGIIYPAASDRFTPEQMHAAAVMMDYVDRRSDEKKLRDLGITSRQWTMWLQDTAFAEYISNRSEVQLKNSLFEAHKGLVKGARNGNVASIKTLYEITGRHDPTKEAEVNVRQLLHGFIEVIQRYVKDPIQLHAIATDMTNMASRESYNPALTGAMMNAQNHQAINGNYVPGPSIIPTELSEGDG